MEVSSTSINAASATVMAMSQGLTLGFHCMAEAGEGFTMVTGAVAGLELPVDAGSKSGKNLLLEWSVSVFSAGWGRTGRCRWDAAVGFHEAALDSLNESARL
jgi:hypothetical protein